MAGKGNAPSFGQNTGRGPSGSRAVIQQGQGVNNVSRGGPPPVNLAKHTQGKKGTVNTNTMPASR